MPEIGYGQRGASLEERDYIGLAPAVEMKSRSESPPRKDDADLRLDLGLGLTLGSSCGDGECGAGTKPAIEIVPEHSFPSRGAGMKRAAASELSRKPLWLGASNAISDVCIPDSASDDAPPAKDQIVGWPPVRLYRKQTLSKPAEMFVKVNMDGMTVGRKVDLNAYGSYKGLLLALEEMFRPAGRDGDMKHFLLSSEPDYVLTYEDKDGDWMLVGDVPWSIFITTVRRLRITRGLEANGTGTGMPRRSRVTFRG